MPHVRHEKLMQSYGSMTIDKVSGSIQKTEDKEHDSQKQQEDC